jgi:DNA processing protein
MLTALAAPPTVHIEPLSALYPRALMRSHGVIYTKGNVKLLNVSGVGFCGSRSASPKGLLTARDSAEQLARMGFSIISGNAAGVDLEAHRAALACGGSTVMVLPEGIDRFRIRNELKEVWDWSRVLVLSSYEPSASWQAYRAMQRNELIIALSGAMVVIEAGSTGGTLNAGMTSLKRGKPLFVAEYEQMTDVASGNVLLLDRGAIPLARSLKTGRAAVERIREAVNGADLAAHSRPLQGQLL